MESESLAAALEREHREIDEGIAAVSTGTAADAGGPDALATTIGQLRRHIYVEEEFLFPPLRDAGLLAPIFVMLREHGQIWASLDALERDLHAGADQAAVHAQCRQLAVRLLHHNLKEEQVVYPQVDRLLSTLAAERGREFLRSGRLPDGWACQRAPRD